MTSRRSFRTAAFVSAAALIGVACAGADSGGGDDVAPAATAAPADEAEDSAPDAGSSAVPASLQFTAPLIGGGEIVGDELAGKPTAFWFWSPT